MKIITEKNEYYTSNFDTVQKEFYDMENENEIGIEIAGQKYILKRVK